MKTNKTTHDNTSQV